MKPQPVLNDRTTADQFSDRRIGKSHSPMNVASQYASPNKVTSPNNKKTAVRTYSEPISPRTAWCPSPNPEVHAMRERIVRKDLNTFDEITSWIPPECFQKDLATSLAYLVWDLMWISIMYLIEPVFEFFGVIGMIIWYFILGLFGLALFVIGHDCGHGCFSNYTWINDLFGHIAHSPILTPYWPWQKSHRVHHAHTYHVTKDHGHIWITEKIWRTWAFYNKIYANCPITALIKYPLYLFAGIPDGVHFWPFSQLFRNSNIYERMKCVFSTACCAVCAYVAFLICDQDLYKYTKFYVLPIFAYGFWLTLVTFLQHLDDDVNVYEDGTWQFVQAQLQTIDRSYGFWIDEIIHHITDGHLAHHLFFTRIPHYHLIAATKALKKHLEPRGLYKYKTTYDFLMEYARLNFNLRYLLGEGTGLLKYAKPDHVIEEEKPVITEIRTAIKAE